MTARKGTIDVARRAHWPGARREKLSRTSGHATVTPGQMVTVASERAYSENTKGYTRPVQTFLTWPCGSSCSQQ